MGYNIVLIEPEIPMNTGKLHLVKPFGFEIDDSRLKRAGLDYWKHIDLHLYESIDEFFAVNRDKPMAFLSSHGQQDYCSIPFTDGMFLVFGKESVGLPKDLLDRHEKRTYSIPLHSEHVRSLNLANAVSVVVYEGLRRLKVAADYKA
jgi:tRNA (cytidine/uridine-2'-O-)-methyltransferase